MPLYEGVGLVGDKHAVIFDIGTAYTKCGFATEFSPRAIIPSIVADGSLNDLEAKNTTKVVDYNRPKDEQYQVFAKFLHQLYFKHLLVNLLAKVFFEYFDVPSLVFAPVHLMACFPLGTQNALIVDAGYTETLVLPVFDSIPMLNCWEASPLAGRAVHKSIEKLLKSKCKVRTTSGELPVADCPEVVSEDALEDLKVRTCFVTHMDRGRKLQAALSDASLADQVPKPPPSVEYQLDGDKTLLVKGEVREASHECLFENDGDDKTIPQLIVDSLLRCPIDLRRPLAERILVIGGTAMAPGFLARLKAEILDLLSDPAKPYATKLPLKTVKFFRAPAKENFVGWLGGSMFGALEVLPHRSVSKEQYQLNAHIPDWTSFDNSLTFLIDS